MPEELNKKKPSEGYYQLTTAEVNENLNLIQQLDIPLRRRRTDGTFGFIPPKEFTTYLKNKEMTFYIDNGSFTKLLRTIEEIRRRNEDTTIALNRPSAPQEVDNVYQKEIKAAESMDITERVQSIMNHNYKLNSFIEQERRFDPATIGEVSNMFMKTITANKATLSENMMMSIPQENLNQIISGTHALIDNLLKLMAKGRASFTDLARLEHIKTGSNTLDHMNRVLIRFISFLFFYNSYFQKFSNDVKKFRAHFKEFFFPYYDRIMKGSQQITLEIVFKDGISPVLERSRFIDYAVGAFMHDIGKLPDVNYHEGKEGFDLKKARRHVFDGFNLLIEAKEFSSGTVATSLLHHDYYGAPYGYKQLDTFRMKFNERRERPRDSVPITYFISYNINDVGFSRSLSYFPCKVVEILDVFDSMTDPEKKYRKAVTPEEAVVNLRKEYIESAQPGIDPILYYIFIDFLKASGIIVDPTVIETLKSFRDITM